MLMLNFTFRFVWSTQKSLYDERVPVIKTLELKWGMAHVKV